MDEALKKRLIGAAVLASLAVIFVPMLVEEPADREPLDSVPEAPPARPFESSLLREEVPLPPLATPPTRPRAEVATAPEAPTVEPRPAPEPTDGRSPSAVAAEKTADEPSTSPSAGLAAWVVQVGSFSSLDNARKLVERLRKAGLQVLDPEPVELRGKALFRVQVGPVLERKRAEAMLPKVNKIAGTRGRIRSYP